jgi:hypothetical protein
MFNINEQSEIMINPDKNQLNQQLFRAARRRLKELTGLDLVFNHESSGGHQIHSDIIARLTVADAEVSYIVQGKHFLTTQNIESTTRQVVQAARLTNLQPMLIAKYVNPSIGDHLRLQEICYLDTVGNAHLRGGHAYIDIQGQRPLEVINKPRSLGPKGLRLVALLLAHPDRVDATVRKLACDAGVALGTVTGTMRELEARGFLAHRRGPKEYIFHDMQELLELWVQGYTEIQRPNLLQQRFRLAPDVSLDVLPAKLQDAGVHDVLVGGEAAAAVYSGYLRPGRATLHVMANRFDFPPALLLPDARGNVDILNSFGTSEIWQGPVAGYVHPLLVYADILATGGQDRRLTETAELLREKYRLGTIDEQNA